MLALDRGLQFEIDRERLALADEALSELREHMDADARRALDACEPPQRLAVLLRVLEGVDPASPFARRYKALAGCRAAPCLQPFL